MMITRKDRRVREQYNRAGQDQFGNLHERMKFVAVLAMELQAFMATGESIDSNKRGLHRLIDAVYDLETEVSYYKAAKPPFGKRGVRLR
jgi:hypothetical protein